MTHPFSDTYITMAKAADELQQFKQFDPLDFMLVGKMIAPWTWIEDVSQDVNLDRNRAVFLPRLDQLLGMLGSPEDLEGIVPGYEFWSERPDAGISLREGFAKFTKDWHELALAVVMKEKYGKQWYPDLNYWGKP